MFVVYCNLFVCFFSVFRLEGQSDIRTQSKSSTTATPTSPNTVNDPEPMEEAKPSEQKSISETFQIFKNTTSMDT